MFKVLEKNIADKIAAGEVIERPVSIVKELVENAVDAGATSIVVEIRNGGKSYIRVTDDGCGIHENEVETAFLRHATSKITTVRDLDAIETLGFRGEALASIGAVSRTEILTKCRDTRMGTRVLFHGGEVVTHDCNRPVLQYTGQIEVFEKRWGGKQPDYRFFISDGPGLSVHSIQTGQ